MAANKENIVTQVCSTCSSYYTVYVLLVLLELNYNIHVPFVIYPVQFHNIIRCTNKQGIEEIKIKKCTYICLLSTVVTST